MGGGRVVMGGGDDSPDPPPCSHSCFNVFTNSRTVSKATLGKLLRDGVERTWAFQSA